MYILFLVGLILILLGFMVHKLKWYFLISGYNTMSKEKQKNVDTEGLGRFMGIYSYVNGAVFILAGALYGFGYENSIIPATIFIIVSTIYFIIKAQTFDHNKSNKGK